MGRCPDGDFLAIFCVLYFQQAVTCTATSGQSNLIIAATHRSINQSIRALMQVDKPQRDRVNEYITVYHVKNNDNLDLNMHTDDKIK